MRPFIGELNTFVVIHIATLYSASQLFPSISNLQMFLLARNQDIRFKIEKKT